MPPVVWYSLGVLVLAGNIYAVWKGSWAERAAGALTLGVIVLELSIQTFVHLSIPFALMDLVLAIVVAVAYLFFAVKDGSLFLGAAMLCQAAELGAVASQFMGVDLRLNMSALSNYETVVVTGFVVASTAWRRYGATRKPQPSPFYEVGTPV